MKVFDEKIVTKSATATRLNIKEQFKPTQTVIENARLLFDNVLSKIEIPFAVNSWYRCARLNKAVGGSKTSSHLTGEAIDIDTAQNSQNGEIFNFIRNNLPFDQLIWEFGDNKNPDWIHVSYRKSGNRKQVLKAVKVKGKTKYQLMA